MAACMQTSAFTIFKTSHLNAARVVFCIDALPGRLGVESACLHVIHGSLFSHPSLRKVATVVCSAAVRLCSPAKSYILSDDAPMHALSINHRLAARRIRPLEASNLKMITIGSPYASLGGISVTDVSRRRGCHFPQISITRLSPPPIAG